MGRPLNKKYFGNTNTNDTGFNQDTYRRNSGAGIGGDSLASALALTNAGNYINRLPTIVSLGAPELPGGVQATGVLHSVAQSASVFNGTRGTGYWVGDVITDANGSTWRVTELEVATFTLDPAHQGSGYAGDDTIPYANGISINLDGVNGGGTPNGNYDITRSTRGSWTTTGAGPTSTGDQIPGLGGTGARWNLTWGVKTVTFVSSSDYAYGTTYLYGTDNVVTGGHGTGAKLSVGFSPSYIAVTDAGSGYVSAPAITFTTTSGGGETRATGATTLTVDDGTSKYTRDSSNAIIAYGQTTSGGSNLIGDIVRQRGSKRFYFTTADGSAVCTLVTDGNANAVGEMTITAYDSAGGEYWVKKITNHRATVVVKGVGGGSQFATDSTVPWTFDDAVNGVSVKIQNA